MFAEQKKKQLKKGDLSKKGSIDTRIKPLVENINQKNTLYTTSSCSGRIVVLTKPENGRKDQTEWLYVTHDQAEVDEVIKNLQEIPEEEIWLKMEGMILHVVAKTTEDAEELLKKCREAGLKRSGIISIGKRIIIEIMGTERVETIIARKGKMLVTKDYLELLIEEANKKIKKNWTRTKKLEKALQ